MTNKNEDQSVGRDFRQAGSSERAQMDYRLDMEPLDVAGSVALRMVGGQLVSLDIVRESAINLGRASDLNDVVDLSGLVETYDETSFEKGNK